MFAYSLGTQIQFNNHTESQKSKFLEGKINSQINANSNHLLKFRSTNSRLSICGVLIDTFHIVFILHENTFYFC